MSGCGALWRLGVPLSPPLTWGLNTIPSSVTPGIYIYIYIYIILHTNY